MSEGDTEQGDGIINPDPEDAVDVGEPVDGSEMDTWNPEENDTQESGEDSWEEDAASQNDTETTLSEDTSVEMDGTSPPQGDGLLIDGGVPDSQGFLKSDTRTRGRQSANDATPQTDPGDSVTGGTESNLASDEDEGCTQTAPGGTPLFLLLLPFLFLTRRLCSPQGAPSR